MVRQLMTTIVDHDCKLVVSQAHTSDCENTALLSNCCDQILQL